MRFFHSVTTTLLLLFASTTTTVAEITRQECLDQGGEIIGDPGNGVIFQPDYECENSATPPIDTVVAGEGEAIASEGEVCCPSTGISGQTEGGISGGTDGGISGQLPPPVDPPATGRPEMTNEECEKQHDGTIVGDIGDGAVHRDGYLCESNGQPPIGTIVPQAGQPIASEGAVCCGPPAPPDLDGGNITAVTDVPPPNVTEPEDTTGSSAEPETASGTTETSEDSSGVVVQGWMAAVVTSLTLFL